MPDDLLSKNSETQNREHEVEQTAHERNIDCSQDGNQPGEQYHSVVSARRLEKQTPEEDRSHTSMLL